MPAALRGGLGGDPIARARRSLTNWLAGAWRRLTRERYRPELHYMRGRRADRSGDGVAAGEGK